MKTPSAPITVAVVCTVLLAALRSGAADGYWDARFGSQGIGGLNAVAVSGSNVYVGSLFTFSAINATNIARWDGTAWSALGGGVNDRVFALAVKGTDVYAGGKFTQAGGVSANYVARWNGSTWSPLGTSANNGVSGFVYCIVPRADGPGAYVGGIFSTAYQGNGTPVTVNYVAYWNGSAWSALGTGLNSTVYGLCSSGSNLYAGGEFSSAGSVTAAHVAKWNGSGWSALTNLFGRDGVNGYVMILLKNPESFFGKFFWLRNIQAK